MGVHCRDWAEQAEKDTARGIVGQAHSKFNQQISDAIRHKVQSQYPEKMITDAEWVGAEAYHDKGDIKVYLDDGTVVPVELKVSFKAGSGTKSNPTQAYFHKKVSSSIMSYTDYDKQMGLLDKRYSLVEDKIGRPIRNASDWAKVLREFRVTDPAVLEQVAEITAPGQSGYASYAAEQLNNYLDSVNAIVSDILAGNNTTSASSSDSEMLYCVVKYYEDKKQQVNFYDFTDMDSTVTQVVSSGQSIKMLNKHGNVVLRFSVTWKNICQGGQTPCFTVFVGNAFN